MPLQNASKEVLGQLLDLCRRLSPSEYARPLPVLSGYSVGTHVRHVLEFYDLLLNHGAGPLSYDHRKHDRQLETCPAGTARKLETLLAGLDALPPDGPLVLETRLSPGNDAPVRVPSSYPRELLYNLEHAIHHMALIRIAVNSLYPALSLPESFGVAYATGRVGKRAEEGSES
jgi:hypothetical protein